MDWIKPNGKQITTNERQENIDYAVFLGWKCIDADVVEAETPIKQKRTRRTKAQIEADNESS